MRKIATGFFVGLALIAGCAKTPSHDKVVDTKLKLVIDGIIAQDKAFKVGAVAQAAPLFQTAPMSVPDPQVWDLKSDARVYAFVADGRFIGFEILPDLTDKDFLSVPGLRPGVSMTQLASQYSNLKSGSYNEVPALVMQENGVTAYFLRDCSVADNVGMIFVISQDKLQLAQDQSLVITRCPSS